MISDTSIFADVAPVPRNHYGLLLHGAIAQVLAAVEAVPEAAYGGAAGFLEGYRANLSAPAPPSVRADARALAAWWRTAIGQWEARHAVNLPLLDLRSLPGGRPLDTDQRIALLISALADEDAHFGALFARMQGTAGGPWPTVQWLGQLLQQGPAVTGVSDPWSRCRPLLDTGLLRVVDSQAPRPLWALRVPPLLLDALREELGERPARGLGYTPSGDLPDIDGLVLPAGFRRELIQGSAQLATGDLDSLVFRGGAGEMPAALAGAVARRLGQGLLTVEAEAIENPQTPPLAPLCTLLRALPLIRIDLSADASGTHRSLGREALPTPRLIAVPVDAALPTDGRTLTLEVPELDPVLRRQVWQEALSGVPADLDAIAERFVLSAGHIPAVAHAARGAARCGRSAGNPDGRVSALGIAEVRRAAADLNRREIGPYADRLPVEGTWSDLIASESTRLRLAELERRCRHRERLTVGLGRGFANSTNRGVRALFSGPSGTGKTLAAKILAAELGLDLYRVDLAAVINKYIGETEKSLKQVLGRAEGLDLVLLLDEGDALLGSRTEVRSSNDRYANLQTNYLLQRLEHYQGIVVVTTNLGDNIDGAFKRRMDVVVPFLPPGPAERLDILSLHLPADHAVSGGFLEQAAVRCALSGGQLRNGVLCAGLLALDEGLPLGDDHLHAALRSEYRKAGAAFPLEGLTPAAFLDGVERWDDTTLSDPLDSYLEALAGGRA